MALDMPIALTGNTALVGGEAHDVADTSPHAGAQDILRTKDIGTNRLKGKKLARRNLLEGSRVKHARHSVHRLIEAFAIADIADIESHTRIA